MSAPAEPLYDLRKIIEMSHGNQDFVKKMVELTIRESAGSKQKITEAYNAGDLETVKYYAHRLKPAVFSLEIKDIKNEILQIEAMSRKGEKTTELQSMIEKLDAVLDRVIEQLKSEYAPDADSVLPITP